jgi:hypothetical protein
MRAEPRLLTDSIEVNNIDTQRTPLALDAVHDAHIYKLVS